MSWEAEWTIERMPSREELEGHLAALVDIARLLSTRVTRDDQGFAIEVVLRTAHAEDIPGRLGLDYRSLDDVRRDLDPVEGDEYAVEIDVVDADADGEYPIVRVYSNQAHNREAWPVVHDIGLALAMRLGMFDEDEERPPPMRELSEDELN